MEFAKLSAPSLKDLFVQQLQGMILSGALPVGTQLPPERTLAEQMQVSRTVVNSGLAELSDQGFLEGGVLGRDEIRSILEVRRALEHLAAERAILYASDQGLEKLGEALERMAEAPGAAQAAEAAFAFQHELALVGGNSIVPLIYYSFKPPVIALWTRFCTLYGIPALVRNTQTLYALLRARDLEGASRWIDEYLEQAISGTQQIYGMA